MTNAVDDRPVNLKAFANLPADAPVVMINLLKFHDGDGLQHYLTYTREVQPHLDRVGGAVRYAGTNPHNVIGEATVLVGRHPGRRVPVAAGLRRHGARPGYQQVHEHHAAALQQGDLVATSQWVLG